jgi:hypothetical protein
MDSIVDKILEATRISLKPGDSDLYWEDATLMYKLEKHSPWDAAD